MVHKARTKSSCQRKSNFGSTRVAFLLCYEVYSKEASPVSTFVVSNWTSWTVQQSKRPLRAFLLVTLERHFLFESRLDRIRSHLFSGDQTWANVRSIQTRALKRLQSVLRAVGNTFRFDRGGRETKALFRSFGQNVGTSHWVQEGLRV